MKFVLQVYCILRGLFCFIFQIETNQQKHSATASGQNSVHLNESVKVVLQVFNIVRVGCLFCTANQHKYRLQRLRLQRPRLQRPGLQRLDKNHVHLDEMFISVPSL